ncbi:MFS-type transporter clz9-like [Cotesia glomerata]|uniref:MFS-type transporter clz9-like n=1 Tax=Cotesia glomerata TaxID=32391 RepID=UPI001D00BBC8|nr:MFS-type transporter clz9-like [Cotesia glomerata]
MDEKGCRLTIHHQQSVLAKKGATRVHLQSAEHAENVTIAGCVNALGNAIPPMIIFKGKRLKPELYDNLPPGSLIQKSAKGYMTNELFKEFLKHLAKFKTSGECLLIFDGAACHLDLSIVDLADSLGIYLYCLPSNTTHELQPLDKDVYRSFEHHWDAEVLLFLEQNPDKKLTKSRFNIILSKVWSKCMTQSNITSGFQATGLYPFNPNAIPEIAFGPSTVTEVPASLTLDTVDEANLQSYNSSTLLALDNVNKENLQPSNSLRLLAIDSAHEENLQLLGSPKSTNQKPSKSSNDQVSLVSK